MQQTIFVDDIELTLVEATFHTDSDWAEVTLRGRYKSLNELKTAVPAVWLRALLNGDKPGMVQVAGRYFSHAAAADDAFFLMYGEELRCLQVHFDKEEKLSESNHYYGTVVNAAVITTTLFSIGTKSVFGMGWEEKEIPASTINHSATDFVVCRVKDVPAAKAALNRRFVAQCYQKCEEAKKLSQVQGRRWVNSLKLQTTP